MRALKAEIKVWRVAVTVVVLVAVLVSSAIAAAPSSSLGVAGPVKLDVRPGVVDLGGKVRVLIVNDTFRSFFWGGCLDPERLVAGHFSEPLGECLALVFIRPHSESTALAGALPSHSYPPGRYRFTLLYHDNTHGSRDPFITHGDLTIQAPPAPKGTLVGEISSVVDPLSYRPFTAEAVTVSDLEGNVVARANVRTGRFRFKLSPGRYELTTDQQPPGCWQTFSVTAGRVTHLNAGFGARCDDYSRSSCRPPNAALSTPLQAPELAFRRSALTRRGLGAFRCRRPLRTA